MKAVDFYNFSCNIKRTSHKEIFMLTKVSKPIQTSELRKNLSQYLKGDGKKPVVVSTAHGKESLVIVGADRYNRMIEAYEDAIDAYDFMEWKKNDDGVRIPWSEIKDL